MSYGRESWSGGRRIDIKQIVCTVIAAVFGVGLVVLVGLHIGKQVGVEDVGAEASAALGPLSGGGDDADAMAEADAAHEAAALAGIAVEADENDYRFFELLDAPAPTRELPEVELAMNPVLEERRNKKKKKKPAEDAETTSGDKNDKPATKKVAEAKPAASEKKTAKPPRDDEPEAAAETTVAAAAAPAARTAEPASSEPDIDKLLSSSLVAKQSAAKPVQRQKPTPRPEADEPAPVKKDESEKKKPRGRFTVQVSSSQDEASAEQLAADLRSQGHRAHVKAEAIPGRGTWYRVRVGQYADREAASAARATIKSSNGYDGFVTSM